MVLQVVLARVVQRRHGVAAADVAERSAVQLVVVGCVHDRLAHPGQVVQVVVEACLLLLVGQRLLLEMVLMQIGQVAGQVVLLVLVQQ